MNGYESLISKYGGRWDFWLAHVPTIARFVDAHARELTRVHLAAQAPIGREAGEESRQAGRILMWDPTRGGMRMPHLHYQGEILILNEAQWAEFSKIAVGELTQKLAKAQRIGFEEVMGLSEVTAGL